MPFEIISASERTSLVKCTPEIAKRLAATAGGIYKIARVCGSSLEDLDNCLTFPDEPKFNWTVSGYCCCTEEIQDLRDTVSKLLKEASVGKSKYLPPENDRDSIELKVRDLKRIVLDGSGPRAKGLDLVLDCCSGKSAYGYTEFLSDVSGFEERDLQRPYQDPTITMGPRIARSLVNLCGLRRGMTILDPFSGLGTILQEAMVLGLNSVGVEISSSESARCRANLEWTKERFRLSSSVQTRIVRADAFTLRKSDLPKVDAVATEPILVPRLEKNPTAERASRIAQESREKYSAAFRAFSQILGKEAPVSIVAPVLVDDRGKTHGIDLFSVAKEFGFRPVVQPRIENPCDVPTSKKKIIQRRVFLMKLG